MLDTDTASYVIKGRSPAILSRLADIPPAQVRLSAITQAELLYGLKRLPADHRLRLGVRQFLTIVQVLPWDAAELYAGIRHQLVSTGQPIGELDMMIAAHAMAIGAVLVTHNMRHFARIAAPLTMIDWHDESRGSSR